MDIPIHMERRNFIVSNFREVKLMHLLKNIFRIKALFFLWLLSGTSITAFSAIPDKNSETASLIPERVLLTTDRDIYVAGENVLFNLQITSNSNAGNPSDICYLVLRNQDNSYVKIHIKAENNQAFGSFYLPDTLKTGYYEVVAFTNYMRNFGEQVFYRKSVIVVNRFDEWLNNLFQNNNSNNILNNSIDKSFKKSENSPFSISLEKDSFKVREKVRLVLDIDVETKKQLKGKVSISVKELNPYTQFVINRGNTSDFNYEINSLSKTAQYPAEKGSIYLCGTIITRDTTPVSNECLFLSTPDSVANLQYAYSNESGMFQFYLPDYYIGKQLIISTRENRNGEYIIRTDDKFELKQPFKPVSIGITRELRKYILESQKIVSINMQYALKNGKLLPRQNNITPIPRIYSQPSSIVYPSDYVDLKNFQEISDNILTGIKIKAEGGKYLPFVLNNIQSQYFQKPAALFLDGVPIYDLTPAMNLGSLDIAKIEICKSSRIKGNIHFPGIVSITTTKKNNSFSFIPGSHTITIGKFAERTYPETPRYTNASVRNPNPDLRQELYWNPTLNLNSEENITEFFASDWPGDYVIEIKGMNQKGEVISTYSKIKVYR